MGFKDLFKKKEVADDNINVTEDKAEEKACAVKAQEEKTEDASEQKEEDKAEEKPTVQEDAEPQQQAAPSKMIPDERKQEIAQMVFKKKIEESDLESLTRDALKDACCPGNPRSATFEDVLAMFKQLM